MLTDDKIERLPKLDRPYKTAIGGAPGKLYIYVSSVGSKLIRYDWRGKDGKQRTLALGKWPEIRVAQARLMAVEAAAQIASGLDPKPTGKVKQYAPRKSALGHRVAKDTFGWVMDEWFATRKEPRLTQATLKRIRSYLDNDLRPALGTTPIAEVTSPQILDMLRKIERRGALEAARRVRQYVSEICRYAIAVGHKLPSDPAAPLIDAMAPPKPKVPRKALPEAELPRFMAGLADYDGEPLTRLGIQLIVHTATRSGEVRFARWSEFKELDNPEKAIWSIPAERMKMRSGHDIPLTPQAVKIVKAIRSASLGDDLLFYMPNRHGIISENTFLQAMWRIGFAGRAHLHGFRSTFSTWAAEQEKWTADVIEASLAHSVPGVRGIYMRSTFIKQRRELMLAWSNFLDQCRDVGELL